MNWQYKGKEITSVKSLPEGVKGFIYIMTFSDGKQYIGRKSFFSTRRKPLGKKALAELTDKRKKKYVVETKESDWTSYSSSNKIIKEKLKNEDIHIEKKEIVKVCFSEKQLTYYESQALFCYGVLEHPDGYYNDNILGKFFRRDLKNIDETEESENN